MPRSYSFDHFTAQKPQLGRGLRAKDKQRFSQWAKESRTARGGNGELAAATARLEELGRGTKRKMSRPDLAPGAVRRGMPIGALPTHLEVPPRAALFELWDEAGRCARIVKSAARELTRASWRLTLLPLHAARLMGRRVGLS